MGNVLEKQSEIRLSENIFLILGVLCGSRGAKTPFLRSEHLDQRRMWLVSQNCCNDFEAKICKKLWKRGENRPENRLRGPR